MVAAEQDAERSVPAKRLRWATQRVKGPKAVQKRKSLFNRHLSRKGADEKKWESNGSDPPYVADLEGETHAEPPVDEGEDDKVETRRIYFNIPLPASERDEHGRPLSHYARNKVRTAKYTALSFIPKNLWLQFHNIANIFFFIIVLLNIFSIFGAENPGLSAVPLIVILTVTAIKDAMEDWRRTTMDNELNNAPVNRLVDWDNVNTSEDKVGLWRQTKKACSRSIIWTWRALKSIGQKKKTKGRTTDRGGVGRSMAGDDERQMSKFTQQLDAEEDENGDVEMTPVPSPVPNARTQSKEYMHGDDMVMQLDNGAAPSTDAVQALSIPGPGVPQPPPTAIPKRFYGSLVNPNKKARETARFKGDYWKNVKVGDFVRLRNHEEIPADIIVLSTSDSDGACYIETKNLDGETNLKVRTALHSGRKVKRARDCEATEFLLESEPPQANLYAYSGVVRWKQRDIRRPDTEGKDMAEPVSINNLLLRGCTLRNTEWVLGVVAFTGEETKIMLNSGITPSKRAQISKDLNWNVLCNFFLLFFMCLAAGIIQGYNWSTGSESLDFFEFGSYGGDSGALNGLITFFAAIVLFQNLIPISLYITLEIIRTAQAFFIFSDTFMYYEKIDYPCTPKSWNISDDLGQIEYIFSDKTGTLTQNVMEFKKCTINGAPYGEAYTEALAGLQKRQGIDVEHEGARARKQIAEDKQTMIDMIARTHPNPYFQEDLLTFVAPHFIGDLGGESGTDQRDACEQFMLALALCHTVITERTPGDPPKIDFKAQSPDEAALVATARDVGFTVMGRNDDVIILNVLGEEREYTVLNTLEFNSSRKRMSAIIRMPDNRIVLYCKGADSIIYSRLKRGEQASLRKITAEHLEMFAREGLRTLCIGYRELGEEQYRRWNVEHDLAAAAVQGRDDKLEAVSDAIERELTLIGGTAIEDRLQDGVPDAIALLARAGIKLWVLTGDKVETAINIGFSCNLLDNDMDLIVLNVDDESLETTERELDKHLAVFGKTGSNEELKAAKKNHEPPEPTHAIVIDGETLKLALDETLKQKFLLLCKQCRSVLCCRVSPAQKAAVVNMVKNGLDVMTLSIGDGANDVAMIQEAHVGVGIAGEEGRQAVMSSDYAIGQFRFLTRLMLVHGRWSYRRLAETIANFFYKNVVWTFALFWYQIYANFDCAFAFDYSYVLLYNLLFTSLPVILMGILDQDVDAKVSLAVPQLFRRGIERKEWTQTKFWIYMIDGLYQSVVVFYFSYLNFAPANVVTDSGRNVNDYKRLGVYIANPAIFIVNIYVLINTYRWDWIMVLVTAISSFLIIFWTGVYTAFTNGFTFFQAAEEVYAQATFWATFFVTIVLSLAPRFASKAFQKIYMPYDVDIIREQLRQGKFDYLKAVDEAHLNPGVVGEKAAVSTSTSETFKQQPMRQRLVADDQRPIYPPSVAATGTTHNPRSNTGSDGTEYTGHRLSFDHAFPPPVVPTETPTTPAPHSKDRREPLPVRPSYDRPRPSFDRMRSSMDVIRPSFEASRDFTSAAYLGQIEGSRERKGTKLR